MKKGIRDLSRQENLSARIPRIFVPRTSGFGEAKVYLGHVDFEQTFAASDFGLAAKRLILTTQDGLRLVAYEVSVPKPRAVVIFLSGIHGPSVTAFFGHARMLADHGYASLLLEMRAHGESEGDLIALGFHEHRDVRAAVDYIRAQPHYSGVPIVAFGLSMGGAVAIISAGLIPEIAGVISLSAPSGFDDVVLDVMRPSPVAAWLLRVYIRLWFFLKYGWVSLRIAPRKQIKALGQRPALLVHSKDDPTVPLASFQRLVRCAPPHVETWVREGDQHMILSPEHFLNPAADAEYAGRILGFLDRHFGARRGE